MCAATAPLATLCAPAATGLDASAWSAPPWVADRPVVLAAAAALMGEAVAAADSAADPGAAVTAALLPRCAAALPAVARHSLGHLASVAHAPAMRAAPDYGLSALLEHGVLLDGAEAISVAELGARLAAAVAADPTGQGQGRGGPGGTDGHGGDGAASNDADAREVGADNWRVLTLAGYFWSMEGDYAQVGGGQGG